MHCASSNCWRGCPCRRGCGWSRAARRRPARKALRPLRLPCGGLAARPRGSFPRCAGLNFRDVLNALGLYPGDAGPLGGECAGVVSAVGAGVETVQVGQEVVALAPGCFRAFAVAPAELVVPKPEGLSFEEAAAIP